MNQAKVAMQEFYSRLLPEPEPPKHPKVRSDGQPMTAQARVGYYLRHRNTLTARQERRFIHKGNQALGRATRDK